MARATGRLATGRLATGRLATGRREHGARPPVRALKQLQQSPRCPGRRRCRRTRGRASPRRRSSCISVSTRRVPVAPSGWPSAIAPPFTLTLSRSSPSSFSQPRYCAAKASLISMQVDVLRATSPARSRHAADRRHGADAHLGRLDADVGPARIVRHSVEAVGLRALGRRQTTSAAAPSTMPLALPAVTVPSLPNAARSFASALERRVGLDVVVRRDDLVALARP